MLGSFQAGISGLYLSQKGLQVTGQNLANVNTSGYARQRVEQNENRPRYIGNTGQAKLFVGKGVDITTIRQIRDEWMDASYRQSNSKYAFSSKQYSVIGEIETILAGSDEIGFSNTLAQLFKGMNNLSQNPDSLEARANFIESAALLVKDANYIMDQFTNSQKELNREVIATTERANDIIKDIFNLNKEIAKYELNGDNANDLRDQRNLLVDELSGIARIEVTPLGNDPSKIQIRMGGRELYTTATYETMELKQTVPGSSFLYPVWKDSQDPVFRTNKPIDNVTNDGGYLKSLLYTRGDSTADYTSEDKDVARFVLPSMQKKFDTLINGIVTMINDMVAPQSRQNGPYGLDESQYVEIFSRKKMDRYDASGNYIAEDPLDPQTLYSTKNLVINPEVYSDYNKICISSSGYPGDNTLMEEMIGKWREANMTYTDGRPAVDFSNYFTDLITEIGTIGNEAAAFAENQYTQMLQIDSKKQQIMGVSMDEEMTNLIRYQHSYNAAARLIKTQDSLIESLFAAVGIR